MPAVVTTTGAARRCAARLAATLALSLAALAGGGAAQEPPAATELLCGLRSGDLSATLRLAPTADPLAAGQASAGRWFDLKAVALGRAGAPREVGAVVVTVVDREAPGGPQTLTQSRWAAGSQAALPAGAAWAPQLTGWQRAYSHTLGRELAWGCAVVAAGATPAGWDRVDATHAPERGEAEAPPARLLAATAGGPQLRLAWLGDVMLADGPGRLIARGGDPFAAVAPLLRTADLRIANLECVVAGGGRREAKPWTFRAHPRALAVLRRHVDAVSLANNHAGDYGPQAFAEMLQRLDRAGLPYFGGGRDLRAAHRPRIVERHGLRIALLGYNEMFPRRFEAGASSPGVAWADEEAMGAAIRAARTQADVVIPYLHWGQEHSGQAHARQRALARRLLQAGADAVVGTHPHVRQDVEVIDGKPVVYSLGNFVFDGFSHDDNNTGAILWMTVGKDGVRQWQLQTVRIDRQGRPHPQPPAGGSAAGRETS